MEVNWEQNQIENDTCFDAKQLFFAVSTSMILFSVLAGCAAGVQAIAVLSLAFFFFSFQDPSWHNYP